jgi:hypothetical protein
MRFTFAAALVGLVLGAAPAMAGGGCATCYRHVVQPPVYGSVADRVMVAPPRTISHVIPAAYETRSEKVLVSPARKVWQVKRDHYGQAIGCWVEVPAQYAVRHVKVQVRAEQVVHETLPAVYETRHRKVLVSPARSGWEPVAAHHGHHPYHGGGHHHAKRHYKY